MRRLISGNSLISSNFLLALLGFGVAAGLAGCGGSADGQASGRLDVSLTDAAMDEVYAVVVRVTGIEVKPQQGQSVSFHFCDDPAAPVPATAPPLVSDTPCAPGDVHALEIDLKTQTWGVSEQLLDGVEVPSGTYVWMRLALDVDPGYVLEDVGGSQLPLNIPSGAQTGLKVIHHFVVPAGGSAAFHIDFDARKSVIKPQAAGQPYLLKPVLRLVDDAVYGNVTGSVDDTLLGPDCLGPSVYAFGGAQATLDDMDGDDGDPVSSSEVRTDGSSPTGYAYKIAFLAPGDYTVAFLCAGGAPGSDPDVAGQDDAVVFGPSASVTVETGVTTDQPLALP